MLSYSSWVYTYLFYVLHLICNVYTVHVQCALWSKCHSSHFWTLLKSMILKVEIKLIFTINPSIHTTCIHTIQYMYMYTGGQCSVEF